MVWVFIFAMVMLNVCHSSRVNVVVYVELYGKVVSIVN